MAVHDTHLQLELSVPSMCLNFVQSLTAEIPPYRRARTCSTAKIIRANPGGVQIANRVDDAYQARSFCTVESLRRGCSQLTRYWVISGS
jgi:hypothetical protein